MANCQISPSDPYPCSFDIPSQLLVDPDIILPLQPAHCGPCYSEPLHLSFKREATIGSDLHKLRLTISCKPTWFSGVGDLVHFYYSVSNAGSVPIAGDIQILDQEHGNFTIPNVYLNPDSYVTARQSHVITNYDVQEQLASAKAVAAIKIPYHPVVIYSNTHQHLMPQGTVDLSGKLTTVSIGSRSDLFITTVTITNSYLSHVIAENVQLILDVPSSVRDVKIKSGSGCCYKIDEKTGKSYIAITIPELAINSSYEASWEWQKIDNGDGKLVLWSGCITTNSQVFPGADLTVSG